MFRFFHLVRHDIVLHLRRPFSLFAAMIFYFLVVILAPLGFGSDVVLLSRISGGLIWISFLLSCLLQIERQFFYERDNQILDIISLSTPDFVLGLSRSLSLWLLSFVPLILITPISGLMLHLPSENLLNLMLSLLLGSPALALIMTLGGALALSGNIGSLLVSISLLPLCLPILIFGISIVYADNIIGFDEGFGYMLLFAINLLSLGGLPFAIGFLLRINIEEGH